MKTKILMVCLGNICRSPLAEGILKSKLNPEFFEVDSAGTGGWHAGEQPDKRSIAVAKKNGIDISGQRARQLQLSDFDTYDYIYVMDKSNRSNVLALTTHPDHQAKVKLILEELYPRSGMEVDDPYYGGPEGFDKTFELLNQACEAIQKKLSQQYQ